MSNLAYFTLDALLGLIAIVILWYVLKKVFSILKTSHKVAKYSLRGFSKPHNQNDRVFFVERVRGLNDLREKQSTPATLVKTIPLTQFQKSQNWSLYDIPTYVRNDIVIH